MFIINQDLYDDILDFEIPNKWNIEKKVDIDNFNLYTLSHPLVNGNEDDMDGLNKYFIYKLKCIIDCDIVDQIDYFIYQLFIYIKNE